MQIDNLAIRKIEIDFDTGSIKLFMKTASVEHYTDFKNIADTIAGQDFEKTQAMLKMVELCAGFPSALLTDISQVEFIPQPNALGEPTLVNSFSVTFQSSSAYAYFNRAK